MALFDPAQPGALIRETLEGIFEETGKNCLFKKWPQA
ncbi:hypothetical protein SAMN05216167_1283 [Spirosoma endophyticum]|uniref:Uncharacterized protein n=1 Tax=Spirosoma endophyticum TaxID=662367 RepID=A0A1I2FVX8_9BACT|nr:hypothetical protein SAMN05216167_1283 [Spirosoma endophyticum]